MRRIATVLATVVAICVLHAPDVLAGGGFFDPGLPDKTVGPKLNVSVVMEGPQQHPSEGTYRQFAVRIDKGRHSRAVLFTGPLTYLFGCLWPDIPDLQTSTEKRFLGSLNNWFDQDALDALIRPFGDPGLAVIIDIDDISCTPVGTDKEYLSFTARIKFAKEPR